MKEEVHLVQQSQQNIREELYDTDELSPDSLRKHIQFVVPNSGGDEFIAPISDTTPADVSQQRISAVNVGSTSPDSPENNNNNNNNNNNSSSNFLQMTKSEENLINGLVDETIDLIDHEDLSDSSSIRTASSERDDDTAPTGTGTETGTRTGTSTNGRKADDSINDLSLVDDVLNDLEMQTGGGSDGYGSQFKMPAMNEIKKDLKGSQLRLFSKQKDSLIDLNVQVADGDNNNKNNSGGDEKASKNVGKLIITAVQESIHSKNSKNSKNSKSNDDTSNSNRLRIRMQNSGANVDGSKTRSSLQIAGSGNNTKHVVAASGVSLDVARFVDQFSESADDNNTTSKNSAARPALNGYNHNDEDNKNNNNDNNMFNLSVDTKAANLFAQQQLQLRKERAKAARQPWNDLVHRVIENQRKEDGDGDNDNDNDIDEDDIKLSVEEKRRKLNKRRIQLVIYEWDHVLCTKPNKYSKSTEATIDLLTKEQIELSFGGGDRIFYMHEHFNKLLLGFSNRLLFTVGKTQNTKIMYKVLNRLDFIDLFNARSKAKLAKNKSRKIANIIGNNHKLLKECQNKLYLLVLRFIHYFAMISQNNIMDWT